MDSLNNKRTQWSFLIVFGLIVVAWYFRFKVENDKFQPIIQKKVEAVCSNHGIYSSLQRCVCDLGFYGDSCQFKVEVLGDSPVVIKTRVALVVESFAQLEHSHEYAAAHSALAGVLGSLDNLDVTVIYSGESMANFTGIQDAFLGWNVRLLDLPKSGLSYGHAFTSKSYEVLRFIDSYVNEFDIIHFLSCPSLAYYTLLSRHQGLLSFKGKIYVSYTSDQYRHYKKVTDLNDNLKLPTVEEFEIRFMEKQVASYADLIIYENDLLLELMEKDNDMSRKFISIPYPPVDLGKNEISSQSSTNVELVFIGPLSEERGLVEFCKSIIWLLELGEKNIHVTFVGKDGSVGELLGSEYVEIMFSDFLQSEISFQFDTSIVGTNDILEYLRNDKVNRIAIIADKLDSYSYMAEQLLLNHIPLLASESYVLNSLYDEFADSWCSFFNISMNQDLAASIQKVIHHFPVMTSYTIKESPLKEWGNLYEPIKYPEAPLTDDPVSSPLVTVVIIHRNRPNYLKQAIKSVEEQTYSNYEIVIVDDGSDDADAKEFIQELSWKWWENKGWRVIREARRYLGAARNTGVKYARGQYVLFLDDDDYAKPNQIETMIKVVKNTNADVVTSGHDVFLSSNDPYSEKTLSPFREMPLGPAPWVGLFRNCFGSASFLVSRQFFLDVGGFTEDIGIGFEDYEFLARIVLDGYHLEAIPESLLWYRRHKDAMSYNTDLKANQQRFLRVYLEHYLKNPDFETSLALLSAIQQQYFLEDGEEPFYMNSHGYLHTWNTTNTTLLLPTHSPTRHIITTPLSSLTYITTTSESKQSSEFITSSFFASTTRFRSHTSSTLNRGNVTIHGSIVTPSSLITSNIVSSKSSLPFQSAFSSSKAGGIFSSRGGTRSPTAVITTIESSTSQQQSIFSETTLSTTSIESSSTLQQTTYSESSLVTTTTESSLTQPQSTVFETTFSSLFVPTTSSTLSTTVSISTSISTTANPRSYNQIITEIIPISIPTSSQLMNITIFGKNFLNSNNPPTCLLDSWGLNHPLFYNDTLAICAFSTQTAGIHQVSLLFDTFIPQGETLTAYPGSATIYNSTIKAFINVDGDTLTLSGSNLVYLETAMCSLMISGKPIYLKPVWLDNSKSFQVVLPNIAQSQIATAQISYNYFYSYVPGVILIYYYDVVPNVAAQFSNSGGFIQLSFDKMIRILGYSSLPSSMPCNGLFNASVDDNGKLGNLTSLQCTFSSPSTIDVILSSDSTVMPNDTILLFEPLIFSAASIFNDSEYINNSITVNNAPNPPTPVAVISSPDVIGNCESLNVSAIFSYGGGGRNLNYYWSISPINDVLDSLMVEANGQNMEELYFQKDDLIPGTTYTFSLLVENFFGIRSPQVFQNVTKSDMPIPTVEIIGSKVVTMYRSQDQTIGCTVAFSSCAEKETMVFNWEFVGKDIPSFRALSSASKSSIILYGEFLLPDTTYTLQVTVSPISNDSIFSMSSMDIVVLPSPVSITFLGGNRIVGTQSMVNLTATYHDLDQSITLVPFSFSWGCVMLARVGGVDSNGPCYATINSNMQQFDPNDYATSVYSTAYLSLPSLFLITESEDVPIIYNFTVTATPSDSRLPASASVSVNVEDGVIPIPLVSITTPSVGNSMYLSSAKLIMSSILQPSTYDSRYPVSYLWTSLSGQDTDGVFFSTISLTASVVGNLDPVTHQSTQPTLVINPGQLAAGARYQFQLNATQFGQSGTGKAIVQMAHIPTSGNLVVTPSQGEAITTSFTFTASYWTIDATGTPLSYIFEVFDPAQLSLPIFSSSASTSNVLNGVLLPSPSGTYLIISCRIISSLGAETVISRNVQVTSPVVLNTGAVQNQFQQLSSNSKMLGSADSLLQNSATFFSTVSTSSSNKRRFVRQENAPTAQDILNNIIAVALNDGIPLMDLTVSNLEKGVCLVSMLTVQSHVVEYILAVNATTVVSNLVEQVIQQQLSYNPQFTLSSTSVGCLLACFSQVMEILDIKNGSSAQLWSQFYNLQQQMSVYYLKSTVCGETPLVVNTSAFASQLQKINLDGVSVSLQNGTTITFPSLGNSVLGDNNMPVNCFCVQGIFSTPSFYSNYSSTNGSTINSIADISLRDCSTYDSQSVNSVDLLNVTLPSNAVINFEVPSNLIQAFDSNTYRWDCLTANENNYTWGNSSMTFVDFNPSSGILQCGASHFSKFSYSMTLELEVKSTPTPDVPITGPQPTSSSLPMNLIIGVVVGGVVAMTVGIYIGVRIKKKKQPVQPQPVEKRPFKLRFADMGAGEEPPSKVKEEAGDKEKPKEEPEETPIRMEPSLVPLEIEEPELPAVEPIVLVLERPLHVEEALLPITEELVTAKVMEAVIPPVEGRRLRSISTNALLLPKYDLPPLFSQEYP